MKAAKVTFTAEYRPVQSVEVIIHRWTQGDNPALPPTWRSLYQVLRELGLEELSQQIEEFLSSESVINYWVYWMFFVCTLLGE
jgi:hypothetical protein